ncbi:MAG: hypothetical protein KAI43_09200 [Candidatus Aureabacteria bacterium]|nr:hypothetical protein [Candidatus Auribacterota bacterium]
MKESIFFILFYIFFIFLTWTFIWGKSTEEAFEFHKNTYWGKFLGEKRYFIFTRTVAILSIIAVTIVFINFIIGKIK